MVWLILIAIILIFVLKYAYKSKKLSEAKAKSNPTETDKILIDYESSCKETDKIKMNGWLFDFNNKRFFTSKLFGLDREEYSFSDVADVQVVEQQHGETKKHTITRGLVGGAIAGPVGAIIGVAGKGKQQNKIDYAGLNIIMKDGAFKTFDVIKQPTKMSLSTQLFLKDMNKVYMTLKMYADNNSFHIDEK